MASSGKQSPRDRWPSAGYGVWGLGCATLLLMLALSTLLWRELGVWMLILAIAGIVLVAILSVGRRRAE